MRRSINLEKHHTILDLHFVTLLLKLSYTFLKIRIFKIHAWAPRKIYSFHFSAISLSVKTLGLMFYLILDKDTHYSSFAKKYYDL